MNRILAGALAGTAATVPMTLVMVALHRRLPPVERYPLPPQEITDVLLWKAGLSRQLRGRTTGLALLAHFAYGAATGALYPCLPHYRQRPLTRGGLFGIAIWAASYLGWIPAAGLLRPATAHPANRNRLMITAHLVWGAATALIVRSVCRSNASP